MNQISRMPTSHLPTLADVSQFSAALDAYRSAKVRLITAAEEGPKAKEEAQAHARVVVAQHETALRAGIAEFSLPIDRIMLADLITRLLKSFTDFGKIDATVYVPQLIEDLMELQPTVGAVVIGFKRLRTRDSDFVPSIRKAFAAVEDASETMQTAEMLAKSLEMSVEN